MIARKVSKPSKYKRYEDKEMEVKLYDLEKIFLQQVF